MRTVLSYIVLCLSSTIVWLERREHQMSFIPGCVGVEMHGSIGFILTNEEVVDLQNE